jgi:hypothetical protein
MHELILLGPFLTRADAARYARLDPLELAHRPDLLHIGKPPLNEAYFGFQFHLHTVDPGVAEVVLALKGSHDDLVIADWLVRPNRGLRGSAPLAWLSEGGSSARAVEAALHHGPEVG